MDNDTLIEITPGPSQLDGLTFNERQIQLLADLQTAGAELSVNDAGGVNATAGTEASPAIHAAIEHFREGE